MGCGSREFWAAWVYFASLGVGDAHVLPSSIDRWIGCEGGAVNMACALLELGSMCGGEIVQQKKTVNERWLRLSNLSPLAFP